MTPQIPAPRASRSSDARSTGPAGTTSASRRRVLVGLVVGVPISVAFLWLAVRNADTGAVRSTLEEAEAGLVALAVVALAAVYGFQAAHWRMIAGSPEVGFARFYELVVSGVGVQQRASGAIGRPASRPLARP